MKRVYEFSEYRAYISEWISNQKSGGHGEKTRIATALKCHPAYVSQVLKNDAHFSSEQVFAFGKYAELSEEEIDFLLLLHQRDRAGSAELKSLHSKKIRQKLESLEVLKNRLKYDENLKKIDQAIYFGEWHHSVIHLIISTMPNYSTLESLRKLIRIPSSQIRISLDFLESKGLIQREGGRYKAGSVNIHIGTDSQFLGRHHTNWRLQAIRSIENPVADDLHYSSVVTMNASDVAQARKVLISAIESIRTIVADSKRESEVQVIALDFFRIATTNS